MYINNLHILFGFLLENHISSIYVHIYDTTVYIHKIIIYM